MLVWFGYLDNQQNINCHVNINIPCFTEFAVFSVYKLNGRRYIWLKYCLYSVKPYSSNQSNRKHPWPFQHESIPFFMPYKNRQPVLSVKIYGHFHPLCMIGLLLMITVWLKCSTLYMYMFNLLLLCSASS